MRWRYGRFIAENYEDTGPGRPGYEEYASAVRAGCARKQGPRVLDLGCGIGRYFHCIEGASLLIGIDASADMLERARATAGSLDTLLSTQTLLIDADFLGIDFLAESFDFVYAIGVIGEMVPLTPDFLARMLAWLTPGGSLFLTVVEAPASRDTASAPAVRLRRIISSLGGSRLMRVLPPRLRSRVLFHVNYSDFHVSRRELGDLLSVASGWDVTMRAFTDVKSQKLGCTLIKPVT
jgi:SAM-dependent methyltransferase